MELNAQFTGSLECSKVEVVASKQLQPLLDKLCGSTRRSPDFTQLCELQVSLR